MKILPIITKWFFSSNNSLHSLISSSTGIKRKIQISSSTASLLVGEGKSHWVVAREDQVNAKGKGILRTFWLNIQSNAAFSKASSESDGSKGNDESIANDFPPGATDTVLPSDQNAKMIDWICELLQKQIKNVLSSRESSRKQFRSSSVSMQHIETSAPIDELVESIILPDFSKSKSDAKQFTDQPVLNDTIISQLHQLVSTMAQSYNNNPFHNFEHACHVTMSVNKLLMRVVSPDLDLRNVDSSQIASHIHDYTNGINSDPITQLAILFSAIIHDIDHRGVSNIQLLKEQPEMARKYKNKSIAEQNSIDIAWTLLMSDSFAALRSCIFETKDEILRFRQVLVNAVMATDIMDKDLNDLRRQRWEKAFSVDQTARGKDTRNLQATIVIEHLMQASDIAHTMQHWHVYRKWNAKLYKEIYEAYRSGRVKTSPKEFWYEGELSFFDNYIIPLAKKLKECNVFGVSSDEYLNYAEKNRAEWEARGREVVREMSSDMEEVEIDDINETTLSSM
jgi:3'5'-cyclic nucleotide phosphodiesterase